MKNKIYLIIILVISTLLLVGAAGYQQIFNDGLFKIYSSIDTTRRIKFDAHGISTSTTRTLYMPDNDVNLGELGGGATAWDDVGDPDNSGTKTITFDNAEKSVLTGDNDEAGSFLTLQNTDADHTVGQFYLLDLYYSADDGDDDAGFLRLRDGGGDILTIEEDGNIVATGAIFETLGITTSGVIANSFDGAGAVDLDYGSIDITDHTFTTNDCTFIVDGGVTISTGDKLQIGSTQWNSGDSIDATKVADADIGDIDTSGGAWTIEPEFISGKSDTTAASGDYFLFWDVTDSQLKKCDADEILGGAGSGDSIYIDSSPVVDPDFQSGGDIDFIDTSNVVTANINADAVGTDEMADADHGDVEWSGGAAEVQSMTVNDAGVGTYYPAMFTSDTGSNLAVYTDGGLSFAQATGTLSSTVFSGSGSGLTNVQAASGDAAVDFFGAGVDAVTDTTTCTDIEGTGLSITTNVLNWSASGIAGHDLFTDFDADEHIDWTAASAGTIHTDNYIEQDSEVTNWIDDVTLGASGALTLPTGQNFGIGSTTWNSGDSIDATKVADADIGDIDTSGGAWTIEPEFISGKSDTTAASGDYFLFWDVTDSQLKKCDADEILGGAGGGDSIYIDSSPVVDPDFQSGGDIDFIDTSNVVTANINADAVGTDEMADADHGDVEWSGGAAEVQSMTVGDAGAATYYLGFFTTDSGTNLGIYTDGALSYAQGTGTLSATEFSGGGGNLTGVDAATGDAAADFFGAGVHAVTDGTACTDIEGTGLSITTGVLNWSAASTDLTDTADLLYETELDDFSELQSQIADKTLVNTADGATWAGTHDFKSATVKLPARVIFCFNIKDIDDSCDDIKMPFPSAMTITQVTAYVTGGTNVVGRLYEVDGDGDDSDAVGVETSDWTFTTGETEDTTLNNSTFDAGDYIQWDTTSVSGSVTGFSLTVWGYET